MIHTKKVMESSLFVFCTLCFLWLGSAVFAEGTANNSKAPLVIGHRGASAYAPENTMASFIKAYELGADMIELDIHASMDGEIFVIHDADTNRTTGTPGLISFMKASDIKKLDAGSWMGEEFKDEKIPLLKDVLEWAKGKIKINIEVKSARCEEKTVEMLHEYEMIENVIVSSFHLEYLKKFKELDTSITTAALVKDISGKKDITQAIEACHPDAINPRFLLLNKKTVDMAHKAGLKVYPYTVNDPVSMKRMISAEVDGIITNYPDLVKDLLSNGESK